ncbi:MAG: NAD(P)H-hydrate dehydratase [Proteobacteria bacterium]|nr:NAD(P)H-hydrate dehydratase [Pseudomonadota bacterium]
MRTKVVSVAEMRELDRRAVEELGLSVALLMENAGLAAYHLARRRLGVRGRRYLVLCGVGHNGGDGLVVARQLHAGGAAVRVLLLGDPTRFSNEAAAQLERARRSGLEPAMIAAPAELVSALADCEVVVDALLGTGLARPVEGLYRAAIEAINAAGRPVLALDIPSGIDGDSGVVCGAAVRACHTVSFGLPKRGNLLFPGSEYGGKLYVAPISIAPALLSDHALRLALNEPPPLPRRRPDGHKGSFGDVLFIAGAAGYYGAPCFAALALLRAGGGYARLAMPRSLAAPLAALASEVVFVPQPETAEGALSEAGAEALLALAGKVDCVALGNGLSLAAETQELVRRLVPAIQTPLLLDGDGLTAIAAAPELLAQRRAPTVLTPHLGELARLLGQPVSVLAADVVGSAARAAAALGVIVVLKGARTVIAAPEGELTINCNGSSALATAGTGDVLVGTIAAMFGLGLPMLEAARAGVFIHGLAGERAAAERGADGVIARDVLEALPAAVRAYRADHAAVIAGGGGALELL